MNKKDREGFKEVITYIKDRIEFLELDKQTLEKYHCRSDLLEVHLRDLRNIKHQIIRRIYN